MSTPSIAPALPGTPALALASPELALLSLNAGCARSRWESLQAEGNRYDVIDGVLYMCTATDTTI